jgi:hypothetical protein
MSHNGILPQPAFPRTDLASFPQATFGRLDQFPFRFAL